MANWRELCTNSAMLIVLLLGIFWHLYDICKLYFSYPTNILIETNFQTNERAVPSIQLCATIPYLTRNRTTTQIFKDIDPNKIIISINTIIDQKEDENLKDYSLAHLVELLSLRYYCFSFTKFKGIRISSNKFLRIRLNPINANGSWWLSVHQSWDIPSSYEWNQVEIKEQHAEITFSEKAFRLLHSPYPTNCKNYLTETEFMTQKDCIRRCRRHLMETKCGFLSHEVDVYKWEPTARFANTVDDEKCGTKLNTRQFCHKLCPNVDCINHYFKPIKVSQREHHQKYIEFNVIVPSEPTTTYIHRPQIQTIEFFCFIASILSLWFGVSVLSIFVQIKRLILKINLHIVLFKPDKVKTTLHVINRRTFTKEPNNFFE